jgi:hypothetical protein
MQIPGSSYPAPPYQPTSRDYSYYAPVKRQRTSVDYGARGMYDADGRMRQMETYPQTATLYGQPGGYPTPMMGYPSGHGGVPDYAVRQPQNYWWPANEDHLGPRSESDSKAGEEWQ